MPWRLLGFIFFSGIILVFAILNWQNNCDIFLGFTTLEKVPVCLTIFASFLLGLIGAIPHMIRAHFRVRAAEKKGGPRDTGKENRQDGAGAAGSGDAYSSGEYGID